MRVGGKHTLGTSSILGVSYIVTTGGIRNMNRRAFNFRKPGIYLVSLYIGLLHAWLLSASEDDMLPQSAPKAIYTQQYFADMSDVRKTIELLPPQFFAHACHAVDQHLVNKTILK